jgi:hypothetical protein
MRKNLMLTSLAIMVAMSEQGYNYTPEKRLRKANILTDPKNPKEIKPKGLKEYWFLPSGKFYNYFPGDSIFYKCFALNDRNAKRKFDAYQKRHRSI